MNKCIVIPIYKNTVEDWEAESIENTLLTMCNYDIYFVCPNKLNKEYYIDKFINKHKLSNIYFYEFDDFYFKNIRNYSLLCLSDTFYKVFSNYTYMLLCQPDAWIFYDNLTYFCNKGYDYLGALVVNTKIVEVNFKTDWHILNGGFSLRNIHKFQSICNKYKKNIKELYQDSSYIFNEDGVICDYFRNELNIPIYENLDLRTIFEFSIETKAGEILKISKKIPFGCHQSKYEILDIFNKEQKENINYDSLDIFIGTNKHFDPCVKNQIYKIIYGNYNLSFNSNLLDIKCILNNSFLDDKFYSEIYMLKYISEHYELKEYIGFCHYRKYFEFFDDIPDITEIFNDYDVILGKELFFTNSIKEHYAWCHNIEDLEIVENIIKNDYNEYWSACQTVLNRNYLYPCNMFIMKSNDFKEYICWVWDILKKYIDIVGTDINKRIEENKEKYLDKDVPHLKLKSYQYRIGGYLAERLTNIYVEKHFNRIKTYNIIITDINNYS